jgi:hypothetical protein
MNHSRCDREIITATSSCRILQQPLNFRGSRISERRERETLLAPAMDSSFCFPCLAIREAQLYMRSQTDAVPFCTPRKFSR